MSDKTQDRASDERIENLPTEPAADAESAEVKGGAIYMKTPDPSSYQPADPSIGLLNPVLGGAQMSPTAVEKKLY